MSTNDAKNPTLRYRWKAIVTGLMLGVVGCAVLTTRLRLYTITWWAMLAVTTVVWLAEVVVASSHTFGHDRLDDFLFGQSASVGCTPLAAIIVSWHDPLASHWVPFLATLGAGVLAAICWYAAARIRQRRGRTPGARDH